MEAAPQGGGFESEALLIKAVAWVWPIWRGVALVCAVLALLPEFALAAEEDTLIVGVAGPIVSLHPDARTGSENFLRAFGHRPLSAPDISWTPVCFLCTALPTIENGLAKVVALPGGGNGMDVTFTLRDDTRWDDGVPVTTADVLFSWQLLRDRGRPNHRLRTLAAQSATATDHS